MAVPKAIYKKILVADDEKSLARALELKLSDAGFKIVSVDNGIKAMQILEKENFDLIVLDLIMPDMDGYEVMEKLKVMHNQTPIIALSNLSQEEDIQKAKDLGANEYYIKSDVPIVEIVKHVQDFFKK
ncbi:MAG TPA: response regulator [Patescibacteria group bacterium]|nr:response regulator [Patescibacteria group bacterium]